MNKEVLSLVILGSLCSASLLMVIVTLFCNYWGWSVVFFILTVVFIIAVVLQFEKVVEMEDM